MPAGVAGVELPTDEVAALRETFVAQVADHSVMYGPTNIGALNLAVASARRPGIWGAFRRMIADDFARWAAERRLRKAWQARGRRGSMDKAAVRLVLLVFA